MDLNDIKVDEKIRRMRILITGAGGFIGSNLLEFFLKKGFKVRGIDNFETGCQKNIDKALENSRLSLTDDSFEFVEGDINDFSVCIKATRNMDIVFHQAALGSVQRSIDKPLESNRTNVEGTLNMLKASAQNNIERFIYASSSSIYGDSDILPKHEDMKPNPKSIYAVSKTASEFYVRLFFNIYGLKTVSLRYFNVFGNRQNPDSIYSAVIPIFLKKIMENEPVIIFGDGKQNRDFTYIDNVIYANYLAMVSNNNEIYGNFYNVGCGEKTSLNDIIAFLRKKTKQEIEIKNRNPRKGDVKSSLASLEKIKKDLNYKPLKNFYTGLNEILVNISPVLTSDKTL